MEKSIGRERNLEKVCFELGTEYWMTMFGHQGGCFVCEKKEFVIDDLLD